MNFHKFVGFVSLIVSGNAIASPCTEGDFSGYQIMKTCKVENIQSTHSDKKIAKVDVCMSFAEKSGGPFGGDLVPWYFGSFQVTKESGETVNFSFHAPDGRHNYRSTLDYTAVDFFDSEFVLESHRVVYPNNSRKGRIELLTLDFNFVTNKISFDYKTRDGVMWGAWQNPVSFRGDCE